MPDYKLVIRRLPPSMSEDEFIKQISPLPNHDYFAFFEAKSGLGPNAFSRAYINFLEPNDMSNFRERFDNYIFLDKEGHEYPAVVEQSMWHKSPKDGPFYKKQSSPVSSAELTGESQPSEVLSNVVAETKTLTSDSIEQDLEFIEFMDKIQAQKKRPQHSPIQTLETNLDQLTNSSTKASSSNKDNSRVITPLIGYVIQQRSKKGSKRGR